MYKPWPDKWLPETLTLIYNKLKTFYKCSMCGSVKVSIEDTPVVLRVGELGLIPVVMVACKGCGNLSFFDPYILGVSRDSVKRCRVPID